MMRSPSPTLRAAGHRAATAATRGTEPDRLDTAVSSARSGADARRARTVMIGLACAVLALGMVAALLPYVALSLVIDACTIIAAAQMVRHNRRRPGVRAWRLLSIGLVIAAIANTTWDALLLAGVFGPRAEAVLGMALIVAYPFMIVGVTSLLSLRQSLAGRGRWIDLLVFTVAGAAMVSWLSGTLLVNVDRIDTGSVLVAVAPLLTIAMFATGMRLAAHPPRGIPAYWYLVAAAFSVAFADLIYANSTRSGDAADTAASVAYGVMYLLIAAALLHPSIRHLPRSANADARAAAASSARGDRRGDGHALLVVVGSQSVIPFVVGIGLTARGDASTGMLLIGIGALGMLAAMRVGRLVTDHERLQRRLEHEAAHDRLTSLPNRGEFVRWSLARTQQSTLLFLDLDGFKQVNDTWGHAAGDELLVTIAERISELAADRGIAARFAGDEFVLVFEGLHPDSVPVAQLVDDLRVSIARPVDVGAASVLVGVSIGVAELDVDDIDASLVLADASMYVDKRSRSTRDRAHATDAA